MRPDLEINEQTFQGRTYYVLKDPVTLRYFRFQREEYAIIQALDGTRDMAGVHEALSAAFPGLETTPEDVARFVNQLAVANLLLIEHTDRAARLFEQRRRKREAFVKGVTSNILFVKIPVFDPDELFTRLYGWLRPIWTRTFFVLLCAMAVGAVTLVISRWDEAASKAPQFFTLHNLPYLWLAIVIVKALHEFGHGLTCKHFGGEVHELGWLFLVFTPCFYCNVSDAWMIPHKRGKLLVTAAGVLTEVFFASIATFAWWWSQPGVMHSFAFNVAVVCSVSAIAFNANPLLRYDGYYFLMDALEIPNLRSRSNAYLKSLWHRYVLGLRLPRQRTPDQHPVLFVTYAIAAYLYRWFILVSIVYFVTTFLDRYGLGVISRILGGIVIVTMFVRPIWIGLKRTFTFRKELHVRAARIAVVFGIVAAACVGIGLIPVSTKVTGSAVIEARGTEFVWVKTPGLVREVLVREGDTVAVGQPMARLQNEPLAIRVRTLEFLARQYQAEATARHALGEFTAETRARILAHGAEAQLVERQADLDDLLLLAPAEGCVFGRDLEKLEGRFLQRGALFCRVGDLSALEARVLISEDEYGRLFDSGRNVGQAARLTLFGQPGRVFHGAVRAVSVGNVPVIRYPALTAGFGGEVVARMQRGGAIVPLKSQVEAVISIDDADEGDLLFGLTGRATILCQRTRVYKALYNWIADAVTPKIPR